VRELDVTQVRDSLGLCADCVGDPDRGSAPGENTNATRAALLDADPDDLRADGGVVAYNCPERGDVLGCNVDDTGQRRCPDCGRAVTALVADGGTQWSDLTGFQRDLLEVIQRLEGENIDIYGLAIKETLSEDYAEVNHSRLYANLDELAERGLVAKSELDKRTNEYHLTDAGEQLLRTRTRRLMQTTGIRTPATDGGHR
jgi:hypothetical protein